MEEKDQENLATLRVLMRGDGAWTLVVALKVAKPRETNTGA